MADKKKNRGLGRGLSALMADVGPVQNENRDQSMSVRAENTLPIEKIKPNPDQPRRVFRPEDLDDLTKSIRQKGVIQPLIVRPVDDYYEIVAGERRWRAAQQAQIHELPVLIRELSDSEVLELAIIENIQRADLNPLEEAMGYRQLMDKFGHTQEKMAEALGKSRSHIANLLRLLQLPIDVQQMVTEGKLTAGHARALITSDDPSALARQVLARQLSVRETEKLAKTKAAPEARPRPKKVEKDADTRALESDLSAALGTRVAIDHKPDTEKGTIVLHYSSFEQLDGLCQILSVENN